jgi:hypothetical protein
VAAFVPAELRPDHFMAAGKLTQAELPARDLGLGRLLLAALPIPAVSHAGVVSRSLAELPGEVRRGWAGDAGRPACSSEGLLPAPSR